METIDTGSIKLKIGQHASRDEGVCALEAVAWLAGESHTDHPVCVCPVIGEFVRSWNDSLNDADRNHLLRPLLPRLIGTATGSKQTEERRAYLALDWLVRHHTPAWFDLVPSLRDHAERLRGLAAIADLESAQAAGDLSRAAWAAARAAVGAALRPTVEALQQSAIDLIDRMIAIGSDR